TSSACFWTSRTARKKSRRRNWKRFARKSRRAEFCSKFEWSAGSSRNGRRPQSPLRRRKTLRKAKGTRHDPAECSVQNKYGVDRNRGAVAVSRGRACGAVHEHQSLGA